jgi:hypothetical protein
MLSWSLFGEPTHVSWRRTSRWTSALAGSGGPLELLSGEHMLGSNCLAVLVNMLIVELRSGEHLLMGTYAYRRRGLPKEVLAEHINLKI